ncbi:phage tail assembly chaperone [Novosphingobium album (ex Liu et al. 2023)]|uniref:Phage tail assembly chaperone n=1 Tax=Novosphingobium album (ex Liu et al. 2023) TaxID=3031130 RepID=A0ABT5WL91_9SPHN|nr:phage tail assembly chaperone [Novosphingobium album (ex Liu et al. 2023)]MDE8650811.1 phage tail assembly chaperone [Novosphingobium album (ex Liu et al. 2023)]
MTTSFGAQALALAGLAARVLGWRPADFWAATPAELAAALALGAEAATPGFDRAALERLMENEHGR